MRLGTIANLQDCNTQRVGGVWVGVVCCCVIMCSNVLDVHASCIPSHPPTPVPGFVGFPEDFHFVRSGLLLALNTVAPFAAAPLLSALLADDRAPIASAKTPRASANACLRRLVLHRCWTATCCCVCAAVQRRHLMIWGIFAPKLLFELCWLAAHAVVALPLILLC